MTRIEQLTKALEKQNMQGGASNEQWMVWLLTDIAVSLANIADRLAEQADKTKPMAEEDDLTELTIEDLEALEQEPRKGYWVTRPHVFGVTYCSECGFELKINNTNFCPNCGADMREVEE